MASPNSSMTDVRMVVTIPLKANGGNGGGGGTGAATKGSGPALVQWTEVQHHPGLICALCQVSFYESCIYNGTPPSGHLHKQDTSFLCPNYHICLLNNK